MAEQQVLGWGTQSAPATRTTHGTENFLLLSVEADFDGTGAAGSWVPAVQIISDAGESVGVFPVDSTLSVGDTATVTFAPFLRQGGGIKFGKINTGNWLDVRTTATGPTGKGVFIDSSNAIDIDNEAGAFNITDNGTGLSLQTTANGALTLAANNGNVTITTNAGTVELGAVGVGDLVVDGTQVTMSPKVTVTLATGSKLEVQDHTSAPIFRVNENGDLQGLTGKALTFNL